MSHHSRNLGQKPTVPEVAEIWEGQKDGLGLLLLVILLLLLLLPAVPCDSVEY